VIDPLDLDLLIESRRQHLLDNARRERLLRQLRPARHTSTHPRQLPTLPRPRLRLQLIRQRT
jgi:hypothetical protein